jgi:hypothetical protein
MYRLVMFTPDALSSPSPFNRQLLRTSVVCIDYAKDDEAIAARNRMLSLNPNDAVAYYNRGNVYNDKGAHVRAIRLNPKLAFAWTGPGDAYNHMGDYEPPDLRLGPGDPARSDICCRLLPPWQLLLPRAITNHAIKDYDQAIRLDPKYTLAYTNRGNAPNAITTARSPTTTRLSSSIQNMFMPVTTAARFTGTYAITAAQSSTTTRRSASIRHVLTPTSTAPSPTTTFRGTVAALIFQHRRVPKGFRTNLPELHAENGQLNNATMLGNLPSAAGRSPGSLVRGLGGKALDPNKRSVADRVPMER